MSGCHHKHDNVDGYVYNEPWYDHERDFVKVCHCKRCVDHGQAEAIMEALRKHFYKSDMQLVACPSPGGCEKGNSIIVNDEVFNVRTLNGLEGLIDTKLNEHKMYPNKKKLVVKVCFGPTCGQKYAPEIERKLAQKYRNNKDIRLLRCGCTGNCEKANNVVVNDNIIHRQTPQSVVQSVEARLTKDRIANIKQHGPISEEETNDILGF